MISDWTKRLLRLRLWLYRRLTLDEAQATLLLAALVGALGGLSSPLFHEALQLVTKLFTGTEGPLVAVARSLEPWQRAAVPILGSLVAGLVLHYGMRLTRHKAVDYMEAVALGDGVIRTKASLVRVVSSFFSIGSGTSIGREGPMVQLSALIASNIGRRMNLGEPRLRLLVACGAAAGISSAYHAPIGGALFVAEIVLGTIATGTFGPILIASVMGTLVARPFFGNEPIFHVPDFDMVSWWEFLPCAVVGVLCGLAAAPFRDSLAVARKRFGQLPVPLWAKVTLGGAVTGGVAWFMPDIWGNGYESVATILSQNTYWLALVALLILKWICTAAAVGSGAVGGIFTPTLLIGAIVGALIGAPLHAWLPHDTGSAGAYALVGMGAFLSATTLAPFMAIVIPFEMTLDYDLVPALMVACVAAWVTAKSQGAKSVYAHSIGEGERVDAREVRRQRVESLMRRKTISIAAQANFTAVVDTFLQNRHRNLFVVAANGRFVGAIPLDAIRPWLEDRSVPPPMLAEELTSDGYPSLHVDDTLDTALDRFAGHPFERLPVLDADGRLAGALYKTDVLLAFAGGAAPVKPT